MKHSGLAALLLVCATQVWAQGVVPLADEASAADGTSGYQRLEVERARETAAFRSQEAACYERFAVNDCLKALQSKHRAALAAFNREETLLRDRDRSLRGAEQLQRSEQKVMDRSRNVEQSSREADQAQGRLQAQHQKQAAHAAKLGANGTGPAAPALPVVSTAPSSPSAPQAPSPPLPPLPPLGPSAAEQAAYRQSFADKQAQAERKRQEVAKRLKDKRQGKLVPPLPVPP